jgi:hypothetical protein
MEPRHEVAEFLLLERFDQKRFHSEMEGCRDQGQIVIPAVNHEDGWEPPLAGVL